ncbi:MULTISPECIES: hypothetical protein [unclassified Streptomyces]|uniref:Uncharacterized protein n=1 Tax=Streptomyces sp. NBC_00119 TaxID=2975659 RepID=A0AAU1TZF3_9ACTN|nr:MULTISPECIES: hypothetical protein [unclassified Streptomyces]MCX4648152.1 hypothetical protein [Streptomyces sp. NBC_01446]MCX5323729.1 hypothetical protein [Streptomyces sp. NBC_00120]
MADSHDWVELWRRVAEVDAQGSRRLIGDVCGGLDLVTDWGDRTIPTKSLRSRLPGPSRQSPPLRALAWSGRCTPRSRPLSSALYAQIDAAGSALENLAGYLHVMDARHDVVLPEFNDSETPNLNNAEMSMGCAGEEARAATCDAETAVRILAETPYLGRQPKDAHETIIAVADLLGEQATLITEHHVHDEAELRENYGDGFGCGCVVRITDSTGSAWEFQRGDSSWNLWRRADVDGSGILGNWIELDAGDARAHPGHVVSLIEQEIA